MRVLLVDDNRLDVELALDAFRLVGLDEITHVAPSGEEALAYLFGHGSYADRARYPMPDLVLLDLKMPGVSGHDVLSRVKSTPGLRRLPIVILTSSNEEDDLARSYENGANSYLVKPASYDGLIDLARRIHQYWLTLNVPPDFGRRPALPS